MKLLEDEIKMLSFFRHMGMLPSEIVPFMSRAGKDCIFCPIHEKCFSIFAHTRQGGMECQSILKCWIEGTPFNLPVPSFIDDFLQIIGFEKENKRGSTCVFYRMIENCHVSLIPHIEGWDLKLSGGAWEPELRCEALDLNGLMLNLEKKIQRLFNDTKELVEDKEKDLDVSYGDTMRIVNFTRKAKKAFEVLKADFKGSGLMR